MAGEWRTSTVDQIKADDGRAIAIGPFGSRMKADRYVADGVAVIRGNNISDTRALVGDLVFVSEETADELRSATCFPVTWSFRTEAQSDKSESFPAIR